MEVNALTRWGSIGRDLSAITFRDGLLTGDRSPGSAGDEVDDSSVRMIRVRDREKLVHWLFRRFSKGFLIGFGGKLFFNVLPYLIRSRGNPLHLFRLLVRHQKKVLHDPKAYGLFLGGFLTLFESTMRTMNRSGIRILQELRAPIAGAVAGVSITALPYEARNTVSVFFFVRALEIIGNYVVQSELLPEIPHMDTLLLMLSSSQVLWSWLYDSASLEPGYVRFLDGQSGVSHNAHHVYSHLISMPGEDTFPVSPIKMASLNLERRFSGFQSYHYDDLMRLDPQKDGYNATLCSILHPESSSCTLSMLQRILHGFRKALPVYVPVYLLPLLLFQHKKLIRYPYSVIPRLIAGIARSCLFLSSYCALAWWVSCAGRQCFGTWRLGDASLRLAGASGVASLIEKKGRRIELALYVFSHALRAVGHGLKEKGSLPSWQHGNSVAFMAAMAVIMSSFIDAKHVLRPSYDKLLVYFFGSSNEPMKVKSHYSLPRLDEQRIETTFSM